MIADIDRLIRKFKRMNVRMVPISSGVRVILDDDRVNGVSAVGEGPTFAKALDNAVRDLSHHLPLRRSAK